MRFFYCLSYHWSSDLKKFRLKDIIFKCSAFCFDQSLLYDAKTFYKTFIVFKILQFIFMLIRFCLCVYFLLLHKKNFCNRINFINLKYILFIWIDYWLSNKQTIFIFIICMQVSWSSVNELAFKLSSFLYFLFKILDNIYVIFFSKIYKIWYTWNFRAFVFV